MARKKSESETPKWKPVGKTQVRQVTLYQEFEERQLFENQDSVTMTLDELIAAAREWKRDAGGKAVVTFAPNRYESIDVSLRRVVKGSKPTAEKP
jgi:hypothetical protein